MFAERSKFTMHEVGLIKYHLMSQSPDDEIKHTIGPLINDVNALMIPRSYIAVIDKCLHVVVLNGRSSDVLSRFLTHSADVIWSYNSIDNNWKIIKDRTGNAEKLGVHPKFSVW